MIDYKVVIHDNISVSDSLSGVVRKQFDAGTEDLVIARFWVQPFQILEKTDFDEVTHKKAEKVLRQLAEDMLSLREDIMSYSREVTRYFEGVKSGEFYEKKDNIEYFKEVFHGKRIVEDFYFHAELCKKDAYRFVKIVIPGCPNWNQMLSFFKKDHANYGRLAPAIEFKWEDLSVIREIRGVIEHGEAENDFDITEISLEETEKGIAFYQPYFSFPEFVTYKSLDNKEASTTLKGITVIDLLDKHFWSIFNVCENITVFPLMANLNSQWQPRLISLQSQAKECPVQWVVEPASNPRRTVNHLPT